MRRLITTVVVTLASGAGWALGQPIGDSWALFFCIVGLVTGWFGAQHLMAWLEE